MDAKAKERVRNRDGEYAKHGGRRWIVYTIIALFVLLGLAFMVKALTDWGSRNKLVYKFPLVVNVDVGFQKVLSIEKRVTITPLSDDPVEEVGKVALETWHGDASYYSREGCQGCEWRDGHSGWNLYMFNGEVLDDMRKTIAFHHVPMNTDVTVTNLTNGLKTTATVTDTGDFEKVYGRIADLSLATKKVLDCNDICQVRIEVFDND